MVDTTTNLTDSSYLHTVRQVSIWLIWANDVKKNVWTLKRELPLRLVCDELMRGSKLRSSNLKCEGLAGRLLRLDGDGIEWPSHNVSSQFITATRYLSR